MVKRDALSALACRPIREWRGVLRWSDRGMWNLRRDRR